MLETDTVIQRRAFCARYKVNHSQHLSVPSTPSLCFLTARNLRQIDAEGRVLETDVQAPKPEPEQEPKQKLDEEGYEDNRQLAPEGNEPDEDESQEETASATA